ncbi:MAG: hypothetical protein IKA88_02190 [Clostridia bacterium]|nr:hypothetical protein [Clostridia bacterium]
MNIEKMQINREVLQSYKYLSITLENCDDFRIDVTDILDIFCELTPMKHGAREYVAEDGFIYISARAKDVLESSCLQDKTKDHDLDEITRLQKRLEICERCADMVSFSLHDENGKKVLVYVPYDPLTDCVSNELIEYSNCPSIETDVDGNMLIAFGKRSKLPKRKDNDYAGIIQGWREYFMEYSPEVLRIQVQELQQTEEQDVQIVLWFQVKDRAFGNKHGHLVFDGCTNIQSEILFPQTGECTLFVAKMIDGGIYVALDGLGLRFRCNSIADYGYKCEKRESL